ncbi:tetratricopeptide repeat protein [Vibrio caribbeanicus]|nr:tetratricopeptide repeat protein [Vibrio caribbeanicus]
MSIMGIAIGATGLLLLGMFLWMLALSMRKKRLEQERKEREIAQRKALEKNRQKEQSERIAKAESGHIPTILYLAKEAERAQPEEAVYWYTQAAKLDNIAGMYGVVRLSDIFNQNEVLKQQAAFWKLCISAAEGSINDQFEMAKALLKGEGTDVNMEKGVAVMESVAAQNHLGALLYLGDWNIADNNPKKDSKKSTQFYHKAALEKSNEARMKLGLSYIQGRGVPSNFERGIYWLERAAEKGYLEAIYKVGEAWVDHKKNGNAIAYIWMFIAGNLGHKDASHRRDEIAGVIGIDSVVGLQSIAKPMAKKIAEKKVVKHSIIKALNRLHSRDIPVNENTEHSEASAVSDEDKESVSGENSESNIEQAAIPSGDESINTEEKLDFSKSPIDKQ